MFFSALSLEEASSLCGPEVQGGPQDVPVFLYVVHKNFPHYNGFKSLAKIGVERESEREREREKERDY